MTDESSTVALIAAQLCAAAQARDLAEYQAAMDAMFTVQKAVGRSKDNSKLPVLRERTPLEFIAEAERLITAVRVGRGFPGTTTPAWEQRAGG